MRRESNAFPKTVKAKPARRPVPLLVRWEPGTWSAGGVGLVRGVKPLGALLAHSRGLSGRGFGTTSFAGMSAFRADGAGTG